MTIEEILNRLDLYLGMKVCCTKKPKDDIIRSKDNIYVLTREKYDRIMFRNSDGWGYNVFYVLEHLGTIFKIIE